jgi:hypothetical protein
MGVEFFDDEPSSSIVLDDESSDVFDQSIASSGANAARNESHPDAVPAKPDSADVNKSRPSSVMARPGSAELNASRPNTVPTTSGTGGDIPNPADETSEEDVKMELVKPKFSLASFFGFGPKKNVSVASSNEEISNANDDNIVPETPARVEGNRLSTPLAVTTQLNSRPVTSTSIPVNDSSLDLPIEPYAIEGVEIDANDVNNNEVVARKPRVYYICNSMTNLIVMLQPNATEIFEGTIKRYDIRY